MIRLAIICLAMLSWLSTKAQSPAQEASTNIISQMLLEELEFDPSATERVTRAYLAELLDANDLLAPPVREQVKYELGISRDLNGWRAAVARFEAECDEIVVITITWIDEESEGGIVTMFIPPNSSCGPALQSILEVLYGRYVSGTEEVQRCVEHVCVNASPFLDESIEGCVDVVHLIDASQPCPDSYECWEETNCNELDREFIINITIPEF